MATVAGATLGARVSTRPYFFFFMALLCVLTAFGGFMPTFWLPMTRGAFVASPILALHGIVFFCWTLFFALQTWLVASGHTANHRSAGLFGIALASVATVFGFAAVINQTDRAAAIGHADAALSFSILPMWHIVFFAAVVTAAIVNIKRPDWHKRLMLVATISALDAPLARLFIYFVGFHGHMPVAAGMPSPPAPLTGITPTELVVDLYLLMPVVYDWRTRGRPHPASMLGFASVLLLQLLETPVSRTAAWHGIASWIVSLGG